MCRGPNILKRVLLVFDCIFLKENNNLRIASKILHVLILLWDYNGDITASKLLFKRGIV